MKSNLDQSSRKQKAVVQATAEAEYIVAVSKALWLKKLMTDLNLKEVEATEIYCDNQSFVAIAKNLVFHGKTKYFKIKYHFVRKFEQLNEVNRVHCRSDVQPANILTKPFRKIRFERLIHDIGVRNIMAKKKCCKVVIHVVANLSASSIVVSSPEAGAHPKTRAHQSCELGLSCENIKCELLNFLVNPQLKCKQGSLSHTTSAIMEAMLLYSTSTEYLDTIL
ncbi:Integrase, catalytic core [Gossypium australe]|uniref:Integrase, catalytic core n=1 Tax=Gossypium australe TaxID=47621 RepID=A0A5B6WXI6_9ROSI|nr:Integrase, catalytic core [Gossypium australe]